MAIWTGKIWAGRPNWRDGILERLEWLTDVLPRRDESEQRRQVRLHPRRTLEYLFTYNDPQYRALLDNFLKSSKNDPALFPIWTDAVPLTTSAASGQNQIQVSTTGRDYDVGQQVLLIRDPLAYEVGEIESMTTSTITLTANLAATWPAGTYVAPARPAFIGDAASALRYAKDLKETRLLIQIDAGSVSTNRWGNISPEQYLGLDLYLRDSSNSNEDRQEWDYRVTSIDSQTGLFYRDNARQTKSQEVIPFQIFCKDRSEIQAFLAFLLRREGRRVPFWSSTWDADFLALSGVFFNGSSTITYRKNGYAQWINAAPGRKDIIAYNLTSGSKAACRIASAIDNGNGTETMTLGVPFSVINNLSAYRWSFLRQVRLESDSVELQWHTDSVVEARTRFREMISSPPQ